MKVLWELLTLFLIIQTHCAIYGFCTRHPRIYKGLINRKLQKILQWKGHLPCYMNSVWTISHLSGISGLTNKSSLHCKCHKLHWNLQSTGDINTQQSQNQWMGKVLLIRLEYPTLLHHMSHKLQKRSSRPNKRTKQQVNCPWTWHLSQEISSQEVICVHKDYPLIQER